MHGTCASTTQFAELFSISNLAIIETEGLLELGYENSFNRMISLQSCASHLHLGEAGVWIGIKRKLLAAAFFFVSSHSQLCWHMGAVPGLAIREALENARSKVFSLQITQY